MSRRPLGAPGAAGSWRAKEPERSGARGEARGLRRARLFGRRLQPWVRPLRYVPWLNAARLSPQPRALHSSWRLPEET
jgi:hypothetical protein